MQSLHPWWIHLFLVLVVFPLLIAVVRWGEKRRKERESAPTHDTTHTRRFE